VTVGERDEVVQHGFPAYAAHPDGVEVDPGEA
jgi:hypothetical protein